MDGNVTMVDRQRVQIAPSLPSERQTGNGEGSARLPYKVENAVPSFGARAAAPTIEAPSTAGLQAHDGPPSGEGGSERSRSVLREPRNHTIEPCDLITDFDRTQGKNEAQRPLPLQGKRRMKSPGHGQFSCPRVRCPPQYRASLCISTKANNFVRHKRCCFAGAFFTGSPDLSPTSDDRAELTAGARSIQPFSSLATEAFGAGSAAKSSVNSSRLVSEAETEASGDPLLATNLDAPFDRGGAKATGSARRFARRAGTKPVEPYPTPCQHTTVPRCVVSARRAGCDVHFGWVKFKCTCVRFQVLIPVATLTQMSQRRSEQRSGWIPRCCQSLT